MLQKHWVKCRKDVFFLACVSGTCINNTSVMMFKKGSFEIGATVYPVAIKVPDLRGQLQCPGGREVGPVN
jgi:hypothetical protein